jgi:orotate phosphoribosyltransferase
VLPSGRHGDRWIDLDAVFAKPERVRPFASLLAHRLAPYRVDGIVGAPAGGSVLAAMIAAELGVSSQPPLAGQRVAVVDDVISVGSDVLAAMRKVRAAGSKTVVLGALAVVGDDSIRLPPLAGLDVVCLERIPSAIVESGECALCAAGVAIDPPA